MYNSLHQQIVREVIAERIADATDARRRRSCRARPRSVLRTPRTWVLSR